MSAVSPREIGQTLLQGLFRVFDLWSHDVRQAFEAAHDGGIDKWCHSVQEQKWCMLIEESKKNQNASLLLVFEWILQVLLFFTSMHRNTLPLPPPRAGMGFYSFMRVTQMFKGYTGRYSGQQKDMPTVCRRCKQSGEEVDLSHPKRAKACRHSHHFSRSGAVCRSPGANRFKLPLYWDMPRLQEIKRHQRKQHAKVHGLHQC